MTEKGSMSVWNVEKSSFTVFVHPSSAIRLVPMTQRGTMEVNHKFLQSRRPTSAPFQIKDQTYGWPYSTCQLPFQIFQKRTCHKQNLVQVANAPTQACLPTWPSSTAFLATPPALRHRRSPGAGSGSSLHLARGDAAHAAQGTSTGRGKCGGRTLAIGTPVAW